MMVKKLGMCARLLALNVCFRFLVVSPEWIYCSCEYLKRNSISSLRPLECAKRLCFVSFSHTSPLTAVLSGASSLS